MIDEKVAAKLMLGWVRDAPRKPSPPSAPAALRCAARWWHDRARTPDAARQSRRVMKADARSNAALECADMIERGAVER